MLACPVYRLVNLLTLSISYSYMTPRRAVWITPRAAAPPPPEAPVAAGWPMCRRRVPHGVKTTAPVVCRSRRVPRSAVRQELAKEQRGNVNQPSLKLRRGRRLLPQRARRAQRTDMATPAKQSRPTRPKGDGVSRLPQPVPCSRFPCSLFPVPDSGRHRLPATDHQLPPFPLASCLPSAL